METRVVEGEFEIKPSDIVVKARHPLMGCFGYGEVEYVAARYVRMCQKKGNQWLALTLGSYHTLCMGLLVGYHFLDDDHGSGDTQPFKPNPLSAGTFYLLNPQFFVRGDDGKYRVTERFIKRCARRA